MAERTAKTPSAAMAAVDLSAAATVAQPRRRHLTITLESDLQARFDALTQADLVAIARDVVRTALGTINVNRGTLSLDGETVEVHRE